MIDPENKQSNGLANGVAKDLTPASSSSSSFQPDDLHDLFAAGDTADGADEDDPLAALRNDPNYSALIKELEYIAVQARLLFEPSAQTSPSDDVWDKIQSQLPSKTNN